MSEAGQFSLSGKRILITGASSGIGRETARVVSALGATVALVGRDLPNLEAVAASLPGSDHVCACLNLCETERIVPVIEALAAGGNGFAGVVHSAGALTIRPLRMQRPADVQRLMLVNCVAGFEVARAFRRPSVRRGPGSIVFVSSVMGITGQPGMSGYSATKGALIAFARSAALELAREEIRVNCVAPGYVEGESRMSTDLMKTLGDAFESVERNHPLGMGRVGDVANAIAFLLGDGARWITGTTLVVDGGYSAQ